MDFTNIIKTFEGDELVKQIVVPMIDALTAMNKYSVLPVYALQFVIDKSTMIPKPVLTAYDNKALITEASSLTPHLEDVIHEKTPKNITPAMIVYPECINYRDIILGNSDKFHYSSAYLVIGKELKDNLKNNKLIIDKIELISDMSQRNIVTKMYWTIPGIKSEDDQTIYAEPCIETMPFSIKLFKMPFSNYLESAKSLRTIVNAISNISDINSRIVDSNEILTSFAENIKEDQMIDIPSTDSVKIFKDFVKVKPNKAFTVFEKEKCETATVVNVFFEMYFKSSHLNVGIFYRYLDNIFDSLGGFYKEE